MLVKTIPCSDHYNGYTHKAHDHGLATPVMCPGLAPVKVKYRAGWDSKRQMWYCDFSGRQSYFHNIQDVWNHLSSVGAW